MGISRALERAAALIEGGERDGAASTTAAMHELEAHAIEPEYVEIVDPETFEPVERVEGPVLVAVAARVGRARLIDNVIATPTTDREA